MKSIEQEKSWYDCVIRVLKEKREAMHYADIADAIVKRKLRRNVGATPNQTVSVVLNTSIKKEDVKSPFVRIERGVYALSGKEASTVAEKEKVEEEALARTPSETAAEEEVAPIGAFGMYWRREMVKWSVTHVRLMGRQSDTSEAVDFANQVGVYLLHDRDRVIYVGKVDANERLGPRLKEHTKGRMAYRWDRFSWFGLRKPTDDGKLRPYDREVEEVDLAALMEAVLIEAIEPGLNRKRGQGLRSVEFYQSEDPALQKDKSKTATLEMLQRMLNEADSN